jgi:hypothetical protein
LPVVVIRAALKIVRRRYVDAVVVWRCATGYTAFPSGFISAPLWELPFGARSMPRELRNDLPTDLSARVSRVADSRAGASAMRPMLLCTLGTSLFRPNLERLKREAQEGMLREDWLPLSEAYTRGDWSAVALALTRIPASERVCGAEINSVASMIQRGYAPPDCGLLLFHSATQDGHAVSLILEDYKHEMFSEIIAFPPLPVSFDYEVWMQASGMLFHLDGCRDLTPSRLYAEDWDEKYESLVERIEIDGDEYLELSPTGQIFHETFRERFRSNSDQILPPPALEKRPPHLEQSGWPGQHPEVRRFLAQVTDSIPQVIHCGTNYYNPDLSDRTRFRLRGDRVEGIFSDGRYCVKFHVETTAQTPGQRAAVCAKLNQWLAEK